jgi:hypothetical protein
VLRALTDLLYRMFGKILNFGKMRERGRSEAPFGPQGALLCCSLSSLLVVVPAAKGATAMSCLYIRLIDKESTVPLHASRLTSFTNVDLGKAQTAMISPHLSILYVLSEYQPL